MNRRDAVAFLVVVGAVPLTVMAQNARKVYRIGVLASDVPREGIPAFFSALRDLGYEDGRTAEVVYLVATTGTSNVGELASGLVARKVDVIVAALNPDVQAAKSATSTIPIVMVFSGAPVESGFVASLARPGGNVTGTAVQAPENGAKCLSFWARQCVARLA